MSKGWFGRGGGNGCWRRPRRLRLLSAQPAGVRPAPQRSLGPRAFLCSGAAVLRTFLSPAPRGPAGRQRPPLRAIHGAGSWCSDPSPPHFPCPTRAALRPEPSAPRLPPRPRPESHTGCVCLVLRRQPAPFPQRPRITPRAAFWKTFVQEWTRSGKIYYFF